MRPAPAPDSLETPPAARTRVLLVDAHVHIHDCFDVDKFFAHAFDNFRVEAGRSNHADAFDGMLLLTECAGVDRFGELHRIGIPAAPAGNTWNVSETNESVSLRLEGDDGRRLFVVSGRQIVTDERLEVLALGMRDTVADGQPIRAVIEKVQASGALCVLPWGFGKWTGRRGRIVRELLDEDLGDNLFLGDNAGRLGLWSRPREFAMADERGIPILPGTDPLPWPSEVSAAAAFGSVLDCAIDPATPFADVRRYLVDQRGRCRPYGELERLVPFVRHQIGMQFKKHRR